ncbi:transmembrane protein, putative [Medicago truncatula]|uniref:Transmembrane protein, putative n=1 Tax=Medicago truncatula TaxID=3880 RepID=A0A072TMP0_MEDTR|nr:transmembrane protein, putative [Medicago truncatula]
MPDLSASALRLFSDGLVTVLAVIGGEGGDDVVVLQWWRRCFLVDRWREESDLWWCGRGSGICGCGSALWWWICEVVVMKLFSFVFVVGYVVARGLWWWLMGRPVGFIGFRGGWCWFLGRINGG